MRRIRINGRVYAVPFESLFRPLNDEEFGALRESVSERGVLQAVVTAKTSHGRSVIDGMHRAWVAEELDLDVPVLDLGELTDDEAREQAIDLNLARRNLSPEDLEAARAERRGRVAAARAAGDSLRAIAAAEGVSEKQVRKDLAAGADRSAPEGKVRGRDGKHYPAPGVGDTPEKLLERARRTLDRLIEQAVQLADSELSADLMALAIANGVPLKLEAGACVWPVLSQVRAALADLAARAAAG